MKLERDMNILFVINNVITFNDTAIQVYYIGFEVITLK